MRRLSILLAPLLLLAGYAAGRFTATPAPFVVAQDDFTGFVSEPAPIAEEKKASSQVVRIPVARTPAPTEVKSPQQVFHDEFYKPYASPKVSARAVAEAGQPDVFRRAAEKNDIDPFADPAPLPSNPPRLSIPDSSIPGVGFEVPDVNTVPTFAPTPIAAQTEQEKKYLNAALKVFRGISENERLLAVEQMVATMEEQDANAELLRLRTELQQLSEKYPKTGAAKKALEAIQTLPVIDPPEESLSGKVPEEAAAPAAPLPAVPEILQEAP